MKKIPVITFLFFIPILFFLILSNPVFAQKCDDRIYIPTPPGDCEYLDSQEPGCECDGGEPTIYISNDTVTRSHFIEVWVDSTGEACPPYTWSISGSGFHFNDIAGPSTAITEGDSERLQLWADGNACGSVIITVTDQCGEDAGSSAREPDHGKWVLIEDITCGTTDGCGYICHTEFYSVQGAFRYMDSYLGGNLMSYCWTDILHCTPYPTTDYNRDYCYCVGYYPKKYHVGIHYKKKWRWDCP